MKSFTRLGRRQFLCAAASAAALAAARSASADDYPNHPVRLVVGFPPGQSADISARLLGQFLSDRLGQPFVIDNRPGASNTVATELVVHAPPDGYTLLWVSTSNYINATLYSTLPYEFHPRHRADRGQYPRPADHGGYSGSAGQNRSGIHRLLQSQSRQGQHGVGRHRQFDPYGRRTVPDADRRRDDPRALSRLGAGAHRSHRRARASDVRSDAVLDRLCQSRQVAAARGDDRRALRGAARLAERGRFRAGL